MLSKRPQSISTWFKAKCQGLTGDLRVHSPQLRFSSNQVLTNALSSQQDCNSLAAMHASSRDATMYKATCVGNATYQNL